MFEYTIDLFKKVGITLPHTSTSLYNEIERMCECGEIGYIDVRGRKTVTLGGKDLGYSKPILIDNFGQFTLVQSKAVGDYEKYPRTVYVYTEDKEHSITISSFSANVQIDLLKGELNRIDIPNNVWDSILASLVQGGGRVHDLNYQEFTRNLLYYVGMEYSPFSSRKVLLQKSRVQFLLIEDEYDKCTIICSNGGRDISPSEGRYWLDSLEENKFPLDPSWYNLLHSKFSDEKK